MSSEFCMFFFFSSRRRHTRFDCDWSSDVCSSDLAIRLAARRLDAGDLAGFDARFRAMGRRPTYAEVRAVGEEFHNFLVKRSGNAKLMEMLEQIREQIRSVWNMSIMAPRRAQALAKEHLAILDALKRGQARRAEGLMVAHVRRVRDTIFHLLD